MYLFISENEVMPYSGEVLKRYIGRRLVKTISNPTEDDLREFGYKDLVGEESPEVSENEFLNAIYEETENEIIRRWEIVHG